MMCKADMSRCNKYYLLDGGVVSNEIAKTLRNRVIPFDQVEVNVKTTCKECGY